MSAPVRGPSEGILSPKYRLTTVGAFMLFFLGAFEVLAVTTVMPIVSRDLDGESLYAIAFSGTLAASVVGMVVAGGWADRRGPSRPLVTAIVVFIVGLLVSGFAGDMAVFIVGRLMQGLGSGAVGVCLYVVVARLYPPVLHPPIFGAFAAAWVLPSLVGPPIAGLVAEEIGWHWVFLGVGVLSVVAAATILPALRQLWGADSEANGPRMNSRGILWALVLAVSVLAISLAGDAGGGFVWIVPIAALAVPIALRPLVPRGTLLARRGLPAAVLLRGAVAAAFFGTEVYLPYFLTELYGLPAWLAGLILTVGAVSWALGSALQGRSGERLSHELAVRVGTILILGGIVLQLVTALLLLSPAIAAIGWFVAGGGMGLLFPRISTLVLAHSTEGRTGFNSAAASISDSTGAATIIAFAGLLFTAVGAATGAIAGAESFVATLLLTTVVAVVAVPIAFRVRSAG
jgi:MFS family permease